MGIPTAYEEVPLVSNEITETHIKLESISEMQLKSLMVLGIISVARVDNSLPVYIKDLNSVPFYIEMELGRLINLLMIFKTERLVVVSGETEKELNYKDLYNFLL